MSTETTPAIERAAREWAPGLFGEENEAGIVRLAGRPHLEWKQNHVRGLARRILTPALEVEEIARAIADDLYGQNAYLLLAVRRPGESSRDHADRIGEWAARVVLTSVLGSDQ